MTNRFILLFSICCLTLGAQTGNSKADSLLRLAHASTSDTARMSLYNAIANIGNLQKEKTFAYSDSSIALCDKVEDPVYRGTAYKTHGDLFSRRSENDSALHYYGIALNYFTQADYPYGVAWTEYSMGSCLSAEDRYPEALTSYMESEKNAHKANSLKYVAYAENGIGTIYMQMKNYSDAEKNHQDALKTALQMQDNKLIGWTYTCLGNVKVGEKDYEGALNCFKQALDAYTKTQWTNGVAGAHNNIGVCCSYLKRYDEAIVNYQEAAKIKEESGEIIGLSIAYQNISELYSLKGDYKLGEEYARKAILYSRQGHSLLDEATAYGALATAFAGMKMYDSAYVYEEKFKQYNDSVYTKSTQDQLTTMQAKYENTQQQQQIELLQKDNEIGMLWRYSLAGGVVLMLGFAGVFYSRYRTRTRANRLLAVQNAQITAQKKEITDSIAYAQRIQQALLASDKLLGKNLGEFFVFYKPKDIVSGDFYWAAEKNHSFFLAVCDSTGHGVPGAFMSLLNISFLNEAITEKNIDAPGEVFNHARKRLLENLPPDGQDGMDGILLRMEGLSVSYAAAHCSPLLIRKGIVQELEADKMPVGKSPREEHAFQTHHLQCEKGDLLYLFTDGYADQFGGGKAGGKKFMHKNLVKLLAEIQHRPLEEQKEILDQKHREWRGRLEQVDDILVVGIKF